MYLLEMIMICRLGYAGRGAMLVLVTRKLKKKFIEVRENLGEDIKIPKG